MKAITSRQRTVLAVLAGVVALVGVAAVTRGEGDEPTELSTDETTPSTSVSTTTMGSTSSSLAPKTAPSSSTEPVASAATRAPRQPSPGRVWHTMAEAPIAGRQPAVAVWTGTELVIWGGVTDFSDGCTPHAGGEPMCGTPGVFDGAAYDPATDSWRRIADGPVPAGGEPTRTLPQGVWTGSEVVVWGGYGDPIAAAYDPMTDAWRDLPAGPLRGRQDFAIAWTGAEVVVAGGRAAGPNDGDQPPPGEPLADAAALDPATGQWRPLADLPAGGWVRAVTAEGAVVVATMDDTTAHRLEPGGISWTSSARSPLPKYSEPVGVAGERWLFATCSHDGPASAAALDLTTLAWESVTGAPPAVCGAGGAVDGHLVAIGGPAWSATAWDPATAAFAPVDPPPDPARCDATVVPAGRSLLVWSGFECQVGIAYLAWTHVGSGVRLDP